MRNSSHAVSPGIGQGKAIRVEAPNGLDRLTYDIDDNRFEGFSDDAFLRSQPAWEGDQLWTVPVSAGEFPAGAAARLTGLDLRGYQEMRLVARVGSPGAPAGAQLLWYFSLDGGATWAATLATVTLDVNINSSHAGDTTKIKDVRLLVIKAVGADHYAASDAQETTSSTSWQTKTTLAFTPASTGDYLVIASAAVATDVNATAMRARLNYVTGSTAWGDKVWYCKDDWDNQAFAVMEKLSLSAAGQTFRLEYRSESGTLCYIHDARILALRLDAFNNAYFASNHATQNTTSSNQDFLALSVTPLALQHTILAVGSYNTVSTTVSGYLNVAKDGSTVEEWNREAPNAAGWQYTGLAQRETFAAVATTWKWRARAETAGTTVNVGNLAIAVLQLDATPAPPRRRYMAAAG